MKTEWNLDLLYKGLDDPAYESDFAAMKEAAAKLHALTSSAPEKPDAKYIESILLCMEDNSRLMMKLFNYVSLRGSVESTNGDIIAQESRIMRVYSETAADNAAAERIFGGIEDVEAFASESEIIREYTYLIKEAKKHCAHLFSNEMEAMVSAMDMTGGGAWGNLQSYLTSTVKVDYKGETVTLSEIRNMAYSDDPEVRKSAYEAELASYSKIADSIAFSLNNIKNQVTMLAEKRGYESPLAMTLEQAKISRATLDAMFEAINDYLPVFRKYLRKKGELLGYNNGLPFFELFAPAGGAEKKYSLEEARDYLTECFSTFSDDMAAMMKEAFDNEWIDFYPRAGKVGGAFCAGIYGYDQSRILTNYDGTFGAVDTLAHELGHAYHNRQVEHERILNSDYPMPVAETASTFNEVHLGSYALGKASDSEKLALLESDLRENVQCVVDIYSRYLFETAVFEQSQSKFLMADDLCKLMLECQDKSYGEGLDPEYRHPYMWACKSHYYSSGLSFYNFPYAFGNLFALGLHSLYEKEGASFVPKYKEMLRTTSVHSCEESGAAMGLDLTKKDFWCESLECIAKKIEQFCALC